MGNLPNEITIGRYHSLHVAKDTMPDVLQVTATTEDGVVMALEHKTLPVGGVQFHPESILTESGRQIVKNFLKLK